MVAGRTRYAGKAYMLQAPYRFAAQNDIIDGWKFRGTDTLYSLWRHKRHVGVGAFSLSGEFGLSEFQDIAGPQLRYFDLLSGDQGHPCQAAP